MSKLSTILAASVLLGLAGGPALAQSVTKTWVSSTTGNDTGTCQFVSPCKTFAHAITQTASAGEIDVKDGGGLVIDGHNTGETGIVFSNGNRLTITDASIHNVTLDGIRLQYGKRFSIINTDVANAGANGLNTPSNSTFFNGVLSRVKVHGSAYNYSCTIPTRLSYPV